MDSRYLSGSINEHDRVRNSTHPVVNQRIDNKTNRSIDFYIQKSVQDVKNRITILEKEWDVEES